MEDDIKFIAWGYMKIKHDKSRCETEANHKGAYGLFREDFKTESNYFNVEPTLNQDKGGPERKIIKENWT